MSDVFLCDDTAVAAGLRDAGLECDVEAVSTLCGVCLHGRELVSGSVPERHLRFRNGPCDLTVQQGPVCCLINDPEVCLQTCTCKYVNRK